jgi:hypothetical protein
MSGRELSQNLIITDFQGSGANQVVYPMKMNNVPVSVAITRFKMFLFFILVSSWDGLNIQTTISEKGSDCSPPAKTDFFSSPLFIGQSPFFLTKQDL